MAPPTQLVHHIESFVDSSRSSAQQATSVDAVASLLKTSSITIEQLVRELELYLTSTDNILRARGILFLAEVLGCVELKPLDSTTIHSLIRFFVDRLTDWRALRGALVGCLRLLRRKPNSGMVTESDATAVLDSLLQNVVVQSLGQHERKLSLEVLACLLSRYPEPATAMGDHLVYGICEAVDGEKDPECLIVVFGIVEVLAQLFPDDLAGPLASFAENIFDILGRYFPIHYTHPRSEDVAVSRDDLSRALMFALSSTPFFEPFSIPLLLEKLSTSLPLAKIDSLKYLTCCTMKYGPARMKKHADAIWHALKMTFFSVSWEPALFSTGDLSDGLGVQDSDIAKEALVLLQKLGFELGTDFVNLILNDEDVTHIMNSISSFRTYSDISVANKQNLLAVACIISTLVKTSKSSCNKVFETLFPHMVDNLEVPHDGSLATAVTIGSNTCSHQLNFGALYLCIKMLGACSDLAMSCIEQKSKYHFADEPWFHVLFSFSNTLIKTFNFDLVVCRTEQYCDEAVPLRGKLHTVTLAHSSVLNIVEVHFMHSPRVSNIRMKKLFLSIVKGLEILATFPDDFSTISKPVFEELLVALTSIIHIDFNVTSLWKLALKTLVEIGTFIDKYPEPGKSQCYADIVVEKLISLMAMNHPTMPYPLILDAISEISTTGPTFLLRVVQGGEKIILDKLSEVGETVNPKLVENMVQLLGCYSNLLPWFLQNQGFEDQLSRFPIAIFDLIEKCWTNGAAIEHKDLLNATMVALKLAVAGCSDRDQYVIVQKAFNMISLSDSFSRIQFPSVVAPDLFERLQLTQDMDSFVYKDEWLLSLISSVIIALRPQTSIPNSRVIIWMSLFALLRGHVPSAQALGSMFNKMHQNIQVEDSSCLSLEDLLELIFKIVLGESDKNITLESCKLGEENELYLNMVDVSVRKIHSIAGLAWIGKGLLMRGHNKVKDVLMIFLRCLLSGNGLGNMLQNQDLLEKGDEADQLSLMRSAADAIHILISDSEDCLNKKLHAISGPLYKQRLFSILIPILLPSITKCHSLLTRAELFRAFGHILSGAPLVAISSDSKKIVPVLLNAISELSGDVSNNDIVYNLLLVLSGLLMDKNGQETIIENISAVVNCLIGLLSYSHKMLVRETAIQCLIAMSTLPYTRIYPMRTQVLAAVSKALGDPKRVVRQEAVRCRHAWASIA